jgi:hypothetical protein
MHIFFVVVKGNFLFINCSKNFKQIRTDIKSGKSQLMSFDDFEDKTNKLEQELELKYAN